MTILGNTFRLCIAGLLATAAKADPPVEFNRDIRPILSDKCFTCHGPDKANRKTALRFDQEAGARIELSKGRFAIVPGSPDSSELYRRITSDKPALRMPPAYAGHDRLNDREIATIRAWIEQGAVWQKHWSLVPPVRAAVPSLAPNAIDALLLQRLAKDHLKFSPEAPRETLIRRVTLDLTGLPPTPGEVEAFLRDTFTRSLRKGCRPAAANTGVWRAHGNTMARSRALLRYKRIPE